MLTYNCYNYIVIGLGLRILRSVSPNFVKEDVIDNFNQLFSSLEELDFQVSLAYRNSRIFKMTMNELELVGEQEKIPSELCSSISGITRSLEDVIFAESSTKEVYVLPNRRYNSEYLLDNPSKLLKEGTFDKLSDISQKDISSACKCLLFGEATAAAFHILRATEAVLKDYYYLHRRQKRLSKPMWANMVDQLRAKTRNKPPDSLLDSLNLIRTAYRNPTHHPQLTYEIDSVQDLFGVCLDAIGRMADEL